MSKVIFHVLIQLIALTALIVVTGCSSTPPLHSSGTPLIDLSAASLPKVAAEYTTSREEELHDHENAEQHADNMTWRFWRDSNQVAIERPQLGMGELWQRDGQSVLHRKLYHTDRHAVEYQPDDLRMMDSVPSWQKLSLLLDVAVLAQLTAGEIEWVDGHPVREYEGKAAESDWHIVMRMDLALPVLIERQNEHGWERTELLNAFALGEAPWQPTPTDGYDVIDFADLGDKEYDPFVIKVLSEMGHDHHH